MATVVPSVDTVGEYVLYYETNKPLMDGNGEALTYNFGNHLLSGVPSFADPSDGTPENGVDYIPVNEDATIKIFPVGEFTFNSLPEDYLLDNVELNTVVYAQAIDQLALDLSSDVTLIEHVTALVGTQTVQNQINTITTALDARIDVLEGEMAGLIGGGSGSIDDRIEATRVALQTNIDNEEAARIAADNGLDTRLDTLEAGNATPGSVAKQVKDAVDAEAATRTAADNAEVTNRTNAINAEATLRANADNTEAAARAAADTTLQNNINTLTGGAEANRKTAYNADLDRQYDVALINAVVDKDKAFTSTDAQTVFILDETPNAAKVVLEVNGIAYDEGMEFTVDRVNKSVTWTYTAAAEGFDMVAGFKVKAIYKTTASITAPIHI